MERVYRLNFRDLFELYRHLLEIIELDIGAISTDTRMDDIDLIKSKFCQMNREEKKELCECILDFMLSPLTMFTEEGFNDFFSGLTVKYIRLNELKNYCMEENIHPLMLKNHPFFRKKYELQYIGNIGCKTQKALNELFASYE
jgi:hypothetical protein